LLRFGRLTKAQGAARPLAKRAEPSLQRVNEAPMNIELSNALVTPVLALLAGILILVVARILNYFVTVYLNVVGLEPPVRFEAAQSPVGTPA
jgi:Protein of unknown function (DUF3096)